MKILNYNFKQKTADPANDKRFEIDISKPKHNLHEISLLKVENLKQIPIAVKLQVSVFPTKGVVKTETSKRFVVEN